MESKLAYSQDGCHTHSRNATRHNSVNNQLIFMILMYGFQELDAECVAV